MKAKYIVKISTYDNGKRQLYCARNYNNFKRALDDIFKGSVELFDDVPDEWLPDSYHNPSYVGFGSVGKNEVPDDLEVRYGEERSKWLVAYLGTVMIEDERR